MRGYSCGNWIVTEVSLLTNIASLQVRRALDASSRRFDESLARLSSGMRINGASDDAAGLAVSSQLNVKARVYTQAINNLNDGISLLNVAEGSLRELSNVMQRLKELASQAANGTYSSSQRQALDNEAGALLGEYNRTFQSTSFNGLGLLNGNFGKLNIQIGMGSAETLSFGLGAALERTAGTGTFSLSSTINHVNTNGATMGDFNGDGITDMAVTQGTNLQIYAGNGSGGFGGAGSSGVYGGLNLLASGDFNRDGRLDIVTGATGATGIYIATNNGNGTFSQSATVGSAVGVTALGILDYNGDGAVDVVSSHSDGSVQLYLNNGSGTFTNPRSYSLGSNLSGLVVGDFNGDGKSDFAAISSASNQVFIYTGTGSSVSANAFSQGSTITVTGSPTSVALGDFNGDGIIDLTTAGSAVNVLMGLGDGSFRTPVSYAVSGGAVTVGDLNTDGITDIVTSNNVIFGNRDGTFGPTASTGVAGNGLMAVTFGGSGPPSLISVTSSVGVKIYSPITENVTSIQNINLKQRTTALSAFSVIDDALTKIQTELGNIGSQQSRFLSAHNTLRSITVNYQAAASRITDADVAQESANLVRSRILQETGAALLAQANQTTALALLLLKS